MTNIFIIPESRIDGERLEQLTTLMAGALGARIHVEHQFVVTSDSQACLLALETLFGDRRPQLPSEATRYPTRTERLTVAKIDLHPEPESIAVEGKTKPVQAEEKKPMVRSWRVEVPGKEVELINGWEKNRRLDRGEFEDSTILRHPSGAYIVHGVRGGQQFVKPYTGVK